MKNLEALEENHKKSMQEIEGYLNHHDEGVKELTRFILETSLSPHDYLPEPARNWVNYSAAHMSSFLGAVVSGLLDDGELNFVLVRNRPQLNFFDRHESSFKDKCFVQSTGLPYRGMGDFVVLDSVHEFLLEARKYEEALKQKPLLTSKMMAPNQR